MSNQIDWSNNFLPGISSPDQRRLGGTGGYGIKTYYPATPYMLSANTVWLEMNTTKAPMNNVNFRKAVAVRHQPAADRERRLHRHRQGGQPDRAPAQPRPVRQHQRCQQYGFSYNPAMAKPSSRLPATRARSSPSRCPTAGRTGWPPSRSSPRTSTRSASMSPPSTRTSNDRTVRPEANGNYDMVLDNNASPDSTPGATSTGSTSCPIQQEPERPAQLGALQRHHGLGPRPGSRQHRPDQTPSKLDTIYAQLETRFLQPCPRSRCGTTAPGSRAIPPCWKNYPSSTNPNDQYTPVMWARLARRHDHGLRPRQPRAGVVGRS